jgi:GTP-binding protein
MPESTVSASALAAGEWLFSRPWRFVRGVPSLEFLPEADRPEIAFAGRSNVGKSSLLNALVRQRGLARTSNTPGRTQELNFFAPADVRLYLVDMPGYGFAKAPMDKVTAWTRLVKDYLKGRPTLKRVFLLIDARHGLKPLDCEIMTLLDEAAVSYQVVLTKVDKINSLAHAAAVAATSNALAARAAAFPDVLATSAARDRGMGLLRVAIAQLLELRLQH